MAVGVSERLSEKALLGLAARVSAREVSLRASPRETQAGFFIVGGDDLFYFNALEIGMNVPRNLKRLTALVLLISLCSALLFFDHSRAQAASTFDKVSPDLRQLIQSGRGDTRVNVIVQSNSADGLLGSLVQTVGGVVQGLICP